MGILLIWLLITIILLSFVYSLIKTIHKRLNLGISLLVFKRSYLLTILWNLIVPLALVFLQFKYTYNPLDLSWWNIVFPAFILLTTILSIAKKLILSAEGFYEEGIISIHGIYPWQAVQSAEFEEEECVLKLAIEGPLFDSYPDIIYQAGQLKADMIELLKQHQIEIKEKREDQ